MKDNRNVEYFIIELPREIERMTEIGIVKEVIMEKFYVALIDDVELYVLNQRGYWQEDTNLMLYDYAMLNEDGDNEVIRRPISKSEVTAEMLRRRALGKDDSSRSNEKVYTKVKNV